MLERVAMDGISTKATSLGAQFHYELSSNVTVDNNMRWTQMSGSFASPFLNVARTTGVLGSTINGQVVTAIKYVSEPNAGQNYTGRYLDNNVNVRTNIRDIGSFANDLELSAKKEIGEESKLTAHASYFVMNQKIAMDWHVNKSFRELSGANPSQLDIYCGAGGTNKLSVAGQYGFNNNWGDCCARIRSVLHRHCTQLVARSRYPAVRHRWQRPV